MGWDRMEMVRRRDQAEHPLSLEVCRPDVPWWAMEAGQTAIKASLSPELLTFGSNR